MSRQSEKQRGGVPEEQEPTLAGGETVVELSPFAQAEEPLSLRLNVVAGPDVGQSRPLRGRVIVGRGEGCDLQLKDASVSRRHLELMAERGGARLRDLNSGNGTQLNGERVAEAALRHGDRIVLGQTEIELVDPSVLGQEGVDPQEVEAVPGEQPTKRVAVPARKPRPAAHGLELRSKRLLAVGGALVVLFGAAAALKAGMESAAEEEERATQAARREAADRARGLFEEGKRKLKDRQFAEAIEKLQAAARIDASLETSSYVSLCRSEIEAEKALAQARALLASGDLVQARKAAQAVGAEASSYDEAQALLPQIDEVERGRSEKEVREAMGRADFEAARALATKLPGPAAKGLLEEIAQAEKTNRASQASAKRQARVEAERRRQDKHREAKQAVARELAQAARELDAGDFAQAQRSLDRVLGSANPEARKKARVIKKALPELQRSYEDARQRLDGGALEASAKPLQRALELWTSMGLQGKLGQKLEDKLAQAAFARGRAAMAREDFGAAGADFALAQKCGNPRAKDGLRELAGHANEVYLEGYLARSSDPDLALRKFRQVLKMVPPGDEVHEKAAARLRELEARR